VSFAPAAGRPDPHPDPMRSHHAIRRGLAGVATALLLLSSAAQAQAQPAPEPAPVPSATGLRVRAWVVDGLLVAVRRGPLTAAGYGGHGVDYAPAFAPGAEDGCP
jgi:hypothetical protein